jgi:hypothetical protein
MAIWDPSILYLTHLCPERSMGLILFLIFNILQCFHILKLLLSVERLSLGLANYLALSTYLSYKTMQSQVHIFNHHLNQCSNVLIHHRTKYQETRDH